jgi:hypothetical protein
MKSTVFVFMNGLVSLPKIGARVLVPDARHVPMAKGMLVSAGVLNATVVASGLAHIRLLVYPTDIHSERGGMVPVPMRYDAEVLSALVPGSRIDVGSIKYAMPDYDWLTDEGTQVVRFKPTFESFTSKTSSNINITYDLNGLKERPFGFGFGKRINLWENRLRDIPLADGDVVISNGMRWYYDNGSLFTHRPLTMLSSDVRFKGGNTLSARNPMAVLIGHLAEKIDLTLIWPDDGAKHRYEAVLVKPGVEWNMTLNIKTPIVMDSAGTCFGNTQATAERCIKEGHIWDRPCSQDSECPYHDPRRGRGGCKSGMCEMPLKVGNASFRVPDKATPAMVHGCSPSDANYPFCSQQPLYQAIFSKESVIPGVPPN